MMSSSGTSVLADICEAIVDCEHKTAPTQTTGIPLIRTTDVQNGRLNIDSAKRVSEGICEEWSRRIEPQPEDIILAREAPVGEVGYIPKGERVCLGQRTVLIRIDTKAAYPRYVLYLLCTPLMRHKMTELAAGSVVPHLNVEDIRSLELPQLPSLDQQKSIGDILGALDDKIEVNRKITKTLEAIGQAVFKRWFIDFEFLNEEGKPYKSSGGALAESEIGMIPKEWSISRSISELCAKINYGYTQSASSEKVGPKFLRVMDINKGDWIDWSAVPHCNIDEKDTQKYLLAKRDIVVARMADPGKVAIFESEIPAVFASYLIRIRLKNPKFAYYLYYLMKSAYYQDFVEGAATGSVQKNLNAKALTTGLSIMVPDNALISAFDSMIDGLRMRINHNVLQSQRLCEIRDALLPGLISGKIRVPIKKEKAEAQ
jgi:type I restriction enzyme S subunit